MKKNVLSFLGILLFPIGLTAQSLSLSILSAQGGYDQSGMLILEWSVGENFIETRQLGDIVITQGFHQPLTTAAGMQEVTVNEFLVYPNPVQASLTIQHRKDMSESVTVRLYDSRASLISQFNMSADVTNQLDMSGLMPGIYLLSISTASGRFFETYRIIKN